MCNREDTEEKNESYCLEIDILCFKQAHERLNEWMKFRDNNNED